MNRPLQIGIIGCGLMGRIHAECVARARGAQLAGFTNRTRDKADALATELDGQVYASLDDMLGDPTVDAVVIASSQQAHAAQAIAAGRAGKHVLCEKPLALTLDEMDAVAHAAKDSGAVFMVAHQLRFHPVVDAVRRAIPKLGRPFHLDLEMALRIGGAKGRCWEDYRSGGFFMEMGCHLTDLSRSLLGDIRHVSAATLRMNPDRATEDFTHALLQSKSGAIASLVVSANHRTTRQGLLRGRLLGEKGRIDFTIYPYARSFNAATLVLDAGVSTFVPDTKTTKLSIARRRSLHAPYHGCFDAYQRQMAAFVQSCTRGAPPPVTLDDGRAAIEIVLAAYASQGAASDAPNFEGGLRICRADAACHPALSQR